jgi:hypothetical protein
MSDGLGQFTDEQLRKAQAGDFSGFTTDQLMTLRTALATPAPAPPAGFDAIQMAINAPGSLYRNTIGGLLEAVQSPVQTAQNLADVVAGGVYNVLPETLQRGLNAIEFNPEAQQRASKLASAVGQEFKQTYTTPEGFKQTMQQDPFRVLGDVSMLTGGVSAALARLPQTASKEAAKTLARVSDVTNPVTTAMQTTAAIPKVIGATTSNVLGMTTGVGPEAVRTAYQSGLEGSKAFLANIRGNVPMTDVLDLAKTNLQNMQQVKQAAYRADMQNIAKDQTVLDFKNIDDAINKANAITTFKGQVVKEGANAALNKIRAEVDAWKKLDPAQFHTPEGLDALKQKIGQIQEDIPFEQKTARTVSGGIYNSIKDEISRQAPEYARVMKEYSDASELVREMERALSLGQKSAADTAMRKLTSVMRNNVNTNFGLRLDMVRQMQQQGGNQLLPAIAGQAMSSTLPRGLAPQIAGVSAVPGAVESLMQGTTPLTLAAAPLFSPRLVGEAGYGLGAAQRMVAQSRPVQAMTPAAARAKLMLGRIPMTPEQARIAALLAGRAAQPYQQQMPGLLGD